MPQDTLPDLAPFPLFAGLEEAARQQIAAHMTSRTYTRGQLLFEQGSDGDDVYFILSGELIALTHTIDGREIIFEHANPGTYLGEIAALDDSPRALSVYARDNTRAYLLPKAAFLALLDDHPSIRRRVIKDLIKRIHSLTERSFEATVYSVEDRVRVRLSRLFLEAKCFVAGGILKNAPTHEEIANIVGANREAVSRSLSRLKKHGIIETGRKQLVMLRPDDLLDGLV